MSKECYSCDVQVICNGGCPKHRFEIADNGIPNKNYLCSGFFKHLSHAVPVMERIIYLIHSGISYRKIQKILKTEFY